MKRELFPFAGKKQAFESAKELDAQVKNALSDPPRGDPRKCGLCGTEFQPSVKFRVLCLNCRKHRAFL